MVPESHQLSVSEELAIELRAQFDQLLTKGVEAVNAGLSKGEREAWHCPWWVLEVIWV